MSEHNPTTYADLVKLKIQLEKKRNDLTVLVQRTDAQIQSVVITMRLLGHPDAKNDVIKQTVVIPDLQGLTQLQALIKLAQANNNRVKISAARDIFLHERLIARPKNAYTILYNVLTKSEKFKKLGAGEYELVEKPAIKQLTINVDN